MGADAVPIVVAILERLCHLRPDGLHFMRVLLLLPFLLLLGCASNVPAGVAEADLPKYTVEGDGQPQSSAAAERSFKQGVPGRVAGDISGVQLKVLAAPMPTYPPSYQEAKLEGVVHVRFLIEKNGTVSNPKVLDSPPFPLAAVSLYAILRWKFEPPIRNGEPIQLWAEQSFTFKVK
jgi:TonB family protein